jgi:hypothetical protein
LLISSSSLALALLAVMETQETSTKNSHIDQLSLITGDGNDATKKVRKWTEDEVSLLQYNNSRNKNSVYSMTFLNSGQTHDSASYPIRNKALGYDWIRA